MLSLNAEWEGTSRSGGGWSKLGIILVGLSGLLLVGCTESATEHVVSPKRFTIGPALRTQIDATVAEYTWVNQYHALAMGEVVKWGKKHQGASKREKCAMVFDVIIKTAAKARLAGKLYSTPHEDSLVVAQNIQSQPFCSPTATMSIFGNSPILPAAAFASMYIDPFTLYGSQMTNGFEQSNGSPAAVNDVLNGVLTTAGNSGTLTNDEFALLVVHANFLASTDSTWTAAQQSGAFGDSAMYVPPQSVFPGYNQNWIVWDLFVFAKSWWAWCGTACRQIGAADLITFLGGVKFGPEAAFYSAAAASAIAAITFM